MLFRSGGKGVLTIQHDRKRGRLVGALIVDAEDELYAITSSGGVIRTPAGDVRKAGRQTKGVRLMNLGEGTTLLAVARNADEPSDVATGDDNAEADVTAENTVEAVSEAVAETTEADEETTAPPEQ